MANYLYKMAQQDAKCINTIVQDEPWKAAYSDAQVAWDIEESHMVVRRVLETFFRFDTLMHRKAAERKDPKLLDMWMELFNSVLDASGTIAREMEKAASRVKIHHFKGCELLPRDLKALRKQIKDGLESIAEWKAWKPPLHPEARTHTR